MGRGRCSWSGCSGRVCTAKVSSKARSHIRTIAEIGATGEGPHEGQKMKHLMVRSDRRIWGSGLAATCGWVAVMGTTATACGQCLAGHLFASDGAASDHFGCSVAIYGDTAVVGSFQDDTPAGPAAGSADVFVRSGGVWTQQAHLFASDGAGGDGFGNSVAISGDTAVVGSYLDDTPDGTN